jgi:polyhydroxybutyrate depolymerase
LINGTDDPINPYRGGDVVLPEALGGQFLGRVLSGPATAERLAALAGHSAPPRNFDGPEVDGDPSTRVRRRLWQEAGRPTVAFLEIVGGGHTIPRKDVPFPESVGRQTWEIDAPLEAWRFFISRGGGQGAVQGSHSSH